MDQNLHLLYLLVSFSIVMQYSIEQFCCSDTRYTECTVLQVPSTQAFQYWVAINVCVCDCVDDSQAWRPWPPHFLGNILINSR